MVIYFEGNFDEKNLKETFIQCGKLQILYLTKYILVTDMRAVPVTCFCASNRTVDINGCQQSLPQGARW